MNILKVAVVGSRRRNTPKDKQIIKRALRHLMMKKDVIIHLVSGGCPLGADKFAEELAVELGLGISIHLPDKSSLPRNPQYYDFVKIYFARNTLIANECDMCIALCAEDRKGGTEDTVKKVDLQNKPVVIL